MLRLVVLPLDMFLGSTNKCLVTMGMCLPQLTSVLELMFGLVQALSIVRNLTFKVSFSLTTVHWKSSPQFQSIPSQSWAECSHILFSEDIFLCWIQITYSNNNTSEDILILRLGLYEFCLMKPSSITNMMPLMVMDILAMIMAKTTFLAPSRVGSKIFTWISLSKLT